MTALYIGLWPTVRLSGHAGEAPTILGPLQSLGGGAEIGSSTGEAIFAPCRSLSHSRPRTARRPGGSRSQKPPLKVGPRLAGANSSSCQSGRTIGYILAITEYFRELRPPGFEPGTL